MSDPDRRRAQRITLQQAVSMMIGNDGHQVPAITENLSSAGVLLYADQLIQEGTEIGLILVVLPVEAEAEGRRMWCFGKVLRVEKELKEGKFGLAIGFQRSEVLSHA
jgi:PilZ domain-containing protein